MIRPRTVRPLLLLALVATNVVVLAMAAYSLRESRLRQEQAAEIQTQNIGNAIDQDVSNSIQKVDLTLQTVTDELERQLAGKGLDDRATNAFLARQLKHLPDLEGLRVSDADGLNILGNQIRREDRISLADRDYFIALKNNPNAGLFVAKPVFGKITKHYILICARRYNYPDGRFAGVAYATITVDHFTALLSRFDIGAHGSLVLRDADLGLITRYPATPDQPSGKIGSKGTSRELQNLIDSGIRSATYHTENSADGVERTWTYHRLAGAPMFVFAGTANSDYLAGWREEVRKGGALVLGFLLLSIAAGGYLYRLLREAEEREGTLGRAKEAADAANVAKSQFLAAMSHEIRTPLNGVLGMAQLMLVPELTDDERYDYARTIINSGQTLLTLLNDILDLSKIEAGRIELEPLAFEPEQVLHETASLFAERAQAKGLALEAVWLGTRHVRYRADASRLRQMLSNLVSNAIKFTRDGFVRIEGRELGAFQDEAILEFAVADSGIGIPAAKHSLLFKPFSQVDVSITREYGGTGLGLSIVRNLARLMGGDVGVESEEGKGTRIWFRIRAGYQDEQDDSRRFVRETVAVIPAPETPSDAVAPHVLVVEDNATNRRVIEAMLRRQNIHYESVENGQEAWERISAGASPDLVLMDIQMPVMDGLEATRRIRQRERQLGKPRLPIVALTAAAFDEDRAHALDAGMDDFLTKPVNLQSLTGVLDRCSREKKYPQSRTP